MSLARRAPHAAVAWNSSTASRLDFSATLWEVAKYFAFIRKSPKLVTAHADTLGDLALGLTSSVAAQVWLPPARRVAVSLRRKRGSSDGTLDSGAARTFVGFIDTRQ